jgi:hypothetical protein
MELTNLDYTNNLKGRISGEAVSLATGTIYIKSIDRISVLQNIKHENGGR